MDAVVLTDRCADRWYRRAIRTSMGAVFTVPWTRVDGPEALHEAGFELVALTPAADAVDLRSYRCAEGRAGLGSEGDGLSARWLGRRTSACSSRWRTGSIR
jgi:tRNA G18 (ribose-2'-O)-methylase SpoU